MISNIKLIANSNAKVEVNIKREINNSNLLLSFLTIKNKIE